MTSGTVQTVDTAAATPVSASLTAGETWEFAAALMQQAPRDLDPEKVRYYLANKKELGADLRSVLGQPLPEFNLTEWQVFYEKRFSHTVRLSNLNVPPKPGYPCGGIVVIPGLTHSIVFDACTRAFKTWRYESDLNAITDIAVRPQGSHVVWVRDTVEADPEMANKSASDIAEAGINTITLKERMILELKYFDETGKHLDIENWTLCAGSRYSDGNVPSCRWSGGRFGVYWAGVGGRYSYLRARVAVS
ncbi:MAG TPA: hypothetical protein VIJ88_00020 [Candidatus Paceibacterota bacterium]